MNKWLKRGINLSLFLIAFNALEHFCHQQTRGFSLERIQFHQKEPLPSIVDENVLSLFNQPYRFYNHGNQCFAFISEDGKTILKFFKYADSSLPASTPWASWASRASKIPLLNHFKPFRPKRIEKTAWKRARDFQGYQIAFDHFREETGLIALHLFPTQKIYPTITLYDKLNIVHSLDLNNTPFILQKRAVPIYEQFSSWIQNNEIGKLQQGIFDLVSLCAKRISKNIFDDDVHFYSNFGFVDEKPIQIDPGHFILKPTAPSELPALVTELKDWFSQNYPPMVAYVEAAAHND